MLTITISLEEGFNEATNEFVTTKSHDLVMEHSLVSLSKWESKWEKPFLGKEEKTSEMVVDYIRCMILTGDPNAVNYLTDPQLAEINEYINSKQTATWFAEDAQKGRRAPSAKVTTSDLIYYWMVAMTIPFECQHWHLNRLLTLIRITDLENQPKKNMSRKDNINSHRALNNARRAKSNG